jgi:hypothetical protein
MGRVTEPVYTQTLEYEPYDKTTFILEYNYVKLLQPQAAEFIIIYSLYIIMNKFIKLSPLLLIIVISRISVSLKTAYDSP